MPLDSDVSNADAQLHVEFYEFEKDPHKGVPFVRIVVPGDKTNVIDQPARNDHKMRFPRQWLHFQMKNSEGAVIGTPLSLWHQDRPEELSENQLQELLILKFQSVEQVATASDTQVMRLGMGAAGVRERARQYLSGRHAKTNGAELAKAQSEIAELKQLVANLAKMQAAVPLAAVKPKGKRGGWNKGKKKVSVNVHNDNAATHAASGE